MAEDRDTKEVDAASSGASMPIPDGTYPTDAPPIQTVLEVHFNRKKHRIKLEFAGDPLVVGRGDEEFPIAIDMTPFEAHEHGVSREHAHFTRNESGVFVEDTGSTNGTRINGATLHTERAYRLRNGDEIEFGTLRTVIRFLR